MKYSKQMKVGVSNMAVQRIEEYRMKNGKDILKVILKPTKVFNQGYFYAPAEAVELVLERSWCLSKSGNRIVVVASKGNTTTKFHQELCKFYHDCYVDYIDHINMVEIDNIDQNLNVVTQQQNGLNQLTRGYIIHNYKHSKLTFQPQINLNNQLYYPFKQVNFEDEACIKQHLVEQDFVRVKLQEDYYMFDFLKYRRGSEDILDLERTGIISEEEAIYKHISKYKDNAWFYLRFGLQDYFRQYNIPIPAYSLDEQGFMVDCITGKRLCPF